MRDMPDKSVDMILTDPPYGIKYQSNMRTKSQQFAHIKNDDNNMRFTAYIEMQRILKDNTAAIIFASWKNAAKDYTYLENLFTIRNCIIWWKHGGGLGDLKHSLLTDYEIAIVCHKGKCEIKGKRDGSVWECNKINPNKMCHPTQKPEALLERMIEKYTDESTVVFDPFMGSGSTGVAAINTGRDFIGIELDKGYYDISEQRINDAVSMRDGQANRLNSTGA